MQMAPRSLPSFSKILLNPSAPHLPLPQAFVRKHLENKIPENPILRSVNGGYSWRLKIKQVGENYCFVNGWHDVVEDSHLEYADFLVFWLVGPSTFKLSIFSPSGCEKDFPVKYDNVNDKIEEEPEKEVDYDNEEEEVDDIYDDGGGDIDGNDGDPFFMITISKHQRCRMRLPGPFSRSAGIDSERTMTIKSLDGMEWPVRLLSERFRQVYGRYYLSAGWSRFRQVNQLSEGDKCVFKFIRSEDKLCLARVTKKRAPAKLSAVKVPATVGKKRTRDLPPVEKKTVKKKGNGGGKGTTRKRQIENSIYIY